MAVTSRIAIASAASLAAQALFGLLMLRLFSPSDVGAFTVVSQISFFWMTLALAQSPLSFLANIHIPPAQALRQALRASLWRWLLLLPVAAMAVWVSKLPSFAPFMAWATAMALLQMGWYMAQPWALRMASARTAALSRAVPPVIAVLIAAAMGIFWAGNGSAGLLIAATCSYGIGALWLTRRADSSPTLESPPTGVVVKAATTQLDDRSAGLRLAHTVADAIAGTAVLLVWQRAYGLAEGSYLAVLLRLLGLFPAVVYAAWPQVLLSRGQQKRKLSLWMGLGGAGCAALAGLMAIGALRFGWFASSWQGLEEYIAPLVIWQCAACVFAAHGHMPFQRGLARSFSWATIGFNALQLGVLTLPLALHSVGPTTHVWWLAGTSALGLLALTVWIAGKKLK